MACLAFLLLAGASPVAAQQSDHIQKGLAALAQYELSENLDYANDALRAFGAALKANKNDAWAHYGIGATLYKAKKSMAMARSLGIADGEALLVAQRELQRAIELNPDFAEAAALLAQVAEKNEDAKALSRARAVLTRSADRGEAVARLDLVLGDTAAILARTPVSALDHLRRAMVLFAKNDNQAGADSYWAGEAKWDETSSANFTADVLVLASPDEAKQLTTGTLEERAAALQLFWHKRAVRDGVSSADRIGEHYRRLAVARRDFRRHERRGAPGSGALIREQAGLAKEIDDRGIIYIKYGKPFDRITVRNQLTRANETWVYLNPDGSYENYRFGDMQGVSGYQLVADPVALLDVDYDRFRMGGARAWAGLATDDKFANAAHFFEEIGRYDPRVRLIGTRLFTLNSQIKARGARSWEGTAERIHMDNLSWSKDNQQRALSAWDRDAAPYVFSKPLIVFHDFATFRGRGCTDVVYSLAARSSSYRVAVHLSDTLKWETQSVDTLVMKEAGATGYLRSTGVFCAQPDPRGYVRFMVTSDSATGTVAGGAIDIHDYTGSGLLMSDLLFATASDGPFVRGRARLALVPPRQFRQGQPFRIFYELYNLPQGRKYRTEISLKTIETNPFVRLLKGQKETKVAFDGEAESGDVVQELRTIVPDLEPGKVEMTLTVTDLETSETMSRREFIWILPATTDRN